MKIAMELLLMVICTLHAKMESQATAFDVFVPKFRILTDAIFNVVTPYSQSQYNLNLAKKVGKLQIQLDDTIPFPCNVSNTRSTKRPSSVHELQPGDIDVIGALGDSLTAGNGLTATDVLQVAIQNRGLSFSIGGQGTWRKYTTLPNILKEFNSKLIGFSLKDSFINHYSSQFNVAETGAMSIDMPFMAKELIRRIKNDVRVNIKEDWKMISLMIGRNDFCCDMCYYRRPEIIIENHRKKLYMTLALLRDSLPRTIVNLIVSPHLKTLRRITLKNRPSICYITHNVLCPCIFGLQFRNRQNYFDTIMSKWQKIETEIAYSQEFDRDDFTVVVQPFAGLYEFPKNKQNLTDYSTLSTDCFHLSQKAHGRAATSLWNNLLEPVGRKSTRDLFKDFEFHCPTNNRPYIYTRRNSQPNIRPTITNPPHVYSRINNEMDIRTTTNRPDVHTRISNEMDIRTTTKHPDIYTEINSEMDIPTTSNHPDVYTLISSEMDIHTTTNRPDIYTRISNEVVIRTTSKHPDIYTEINSEMDITTTTNRPDLYTRINNEMGIPTTSNHPDVYTRINSEMDIHTTTTRPDIFTRISNEMDIRTTTKQPDIHTEINTEMDITTTTNRPDMYTRINNEMDIPTTSNDPDLYTEINSEKDYEISEIDIR